MVVIISLVAIDWLFLAYLLIVFGGLGIIFYLFKAGEGNPEIAALRRQILELNIEKDDIISQQKKLEKKIQSLYKITDSQHVEIRELNEKLNEK